MNIDNYHTLYIVFLVLAIIFLLLTILFFFIFNIKKIISVKTGYEKKQSIKETIQINQTEDIKKRKKYKSSSFRLPSEELLSEKLSSGQLIEQKKNEKEDKDITKEQWVGDGDTVKLQHSSVEETVILSHNAKEQEQGTVVLGMPQQDNTYNLGQIKHYNIDKYILKDNEFFNIIETQIEISTKNIINDKTN